jgi:hypothetical protein
MAIFRLHLIPSVPLTAQDAPNVISGTERIEQLKYKMIHDS